MKQIRSVLILILLFGIYSCNKEKVDEEKVAFEFDSQFIVGEWYHAYGNYVEDISFLSNLKSTGITYENRSSNYDVVDNISGNWFVTSYGSVLSIDRYWKQRNVLDKNNYSLVDKKEYYMLLIDKEFGNTESFIKIVENAKLKVGEEYSVIFLRNNSIIASNYISSNNKIAEVSSDGRLTAKGPGIAFIRIESNVGPMVIKIEVV